MKTFLPPNQFAPHVPVGVDEAGASAPAPTPDAPAALSMASSAGAMETEAAAVNGSPTTAVASDISDIPEIFRVANLLCVEAREFQPDYPGIYQAMMDPNAPRETDDVWSDLAPLFLQNAKA